MLFRAHIQSVFSVGIICFDLFDLSTLLALCLVAKLVTLTFNILGRVRFILNKWH